MCYIFWAKFGTLFQCALCTLEFMDVLQRKRNERTRIPGKISMRVAALLYHNPLYIWQGVQPKSG